LGRRERERERERDRKKERRGGGLAMFSTCSALVTITAWIEVTLLCSKWMKEQDAFSKKKKGR
jgi:hypothetical protein